MVIDFKELHAFVNTHWLADGPVFFTSNYQYNSIKELHIIYLK